MESVRCRPKIGVARTVILGPVMWVLTSGERKSSPRRTSTHQSSGTPHCCNLSLSSWNVGSVCLFHSIFFLAACWGSCTSIHSILANICLPIPQKNPVSYRITPSRTTNHSIPSWRRQCDFICGHHHSKNILNLQQFRPNDPNANPLRWVVNSQLVLNKVYGDSVPPGGGLVPICKVFWVWGKVKRRIAILALRGDTEIATKEQSIRCLRFQTSGITPSRCR